MSTIASHFPELPNYRLLDFGAARKLEQFGKLIVDRPSPGATNAKSAPELWSLPDIRFEVETSREGNPERGTWHYSDSCSESLTGWVLKLGKIEMQLKTTPAGQVGAFPEHWVRWPWLADQLLKDQLKVDQLKVDQLKVDQLKVDQLKVDQLKVDQSKKPPRVLNLFAYTGATTLAMASLGCDVTHVDASKPTVQWARQNCHQSNLENAPIRWIVDDAAAFVRREVKRGKRYEAILLDPPSYGHGGGKGSRAARWEIHRDLLPLLVDCWQLLSESRAAVLLCGHSANIRIADLNEALMDRFGNAALGQHRVKQAFLQDTSGRKLDCGFAAMYSWPS